MSNPEPITPATRELINLLRRWPRQRVAEVLLAESILAKGEAPATLLQGRLPRRLAAPGKRHQTHAAVDSPAVGFFDEQFPELLRAIPDPPLVLYYQGDLAVLEGPAVAIVGARKCTGQGKQNAQTLARDIADLGVHIVSGLALGIDGAAHLGALRSTGAGRTVAVLGAGLQQLYPARHHGLARDIIAAGGLLLSEYPARQTPRAYQFPERNRLISGLSLATVVIEASDRSGSLITARFAAEQGRDVLAMPGPIGSFVSAGCHRLIQQGAGLVTNAVEVLDNAGLEPPSKAAAVETPIVELSEAGRVVLAHLQGYALSLDELLVVIDMPAATLTCALVELELAGFVEQGSLGYIRTSAIS